MAKSKLQKKEIIDDLSKKIKDAKGVVFASYAGLKVQEIEELKKELRKQNSQVTVAKKTLLKIALKNNSLENDTINQMENGIALVTGVDEVVPAKTVDTFAKKHDKVKFLGGMMEGKFIDVAQVKVLASLPTKQELLAKMVGSMKAPISGFVNVMAGNLRGLVNVLTAIKDKK